MHDGRIPLAIARNTSHGQEPFLSLLYVQGNVLEAKGHGPGRHLDSRE